MIDETRLQAWRAVLCGTLMQLADAGYDVLRRPVNTVIDQRPRSNSPGVALRS